MPDPNGGRGQAHGGSAKIVEFGDSLRAWCLHGVSFQAVAACVTACWQAAP